MSFRKDCYSRCWGRCIKCFEQYYFTTLHKSQWKLVISLSLVGISDCRKIQVTSLFKKQEIKEEEETNIYPPFPINWMIPLANQIVHEEKFLFIEVVQPINEENMAELEYDHFTIPIISEFCQWTSTAANIMKRDSQML